VDGINGFGRSAKQRWGLNEGLKRFDENTTDIVALRETQKSVKLEIDYLQKMKGESGKNKQGDGEGYKRKSEEVVTIDDFSPLQEISKKKPIEKKARREKDDLRALLEQRFQEKNQMPDNDDDEKEEEDIKHENEGGGSEEDSDDDN
jgi:hypothetical protein